jgi:hypothetical protein
MADWLGDLLDQVPVLECIVRGIAVMRRRSDRCGCFYILLLPPASLIRMLIFLPFLTLR